MHEIFMSRFFHAVLRDSYRSVANISQYVFYIFPFQTNQYELYDAPDVNP